MSLRAGVVSLGIDYIPLKYLPNQWIAVFARSDWLPYLGISLDIYCFGTGFKMAYRFATVSKEEILAINKAAAPTNTAKKETKSGLSVFTGW